MKRRAQKILKEMTKETKSMQRTHRRRCRRPAIKTKAAPPRPRSGFMIAHIAVFAAALILAAPHEIELRVMARRTPLFVFSPINETQIRRGSSTSRTKMRERPSSVALTRITHMKYFPPVINTPKSYDQKMTILKSSASSSIEIPATIDSRRSLSSVQSRVVKALMVTYIASMCVALPA